MADEKGLPDSINQGISLLRPNRYYMSIVTGRTYARVNQLLGSSVIRHIITTGERKIAAFENGARLLDVSTMINLSYSAIPQRSIEELHHFLLKNSEYVQLLFWAPEAPDKPPIAWFANKISFLSYHKEYRDVGKTFSGCSKAAKIDLENTMLSANPCMFAMKFSAECGIESLSEYFSIVRNGRWFNLMSKRYLGKESVIDAFSSIFAIDPADIVAAGNDENDLAMLNRKDIGGSIVVGSKLRGRITQPECRTRYAYSPYHFGLNLFDYLRALLAK